MRVNSSIKSDLSKEIDLVSAKEQAHLPEAKAEFQMNLQEATKKEHRENLNYLMQKITKNAERLAKSRTIGDLKEYKRSVREFLQETMGKVYQAQDGMGRDSTGRHKLFVLIKKVDAKLEELSFELLRKQKDNLELLEKLDEIRGLLVDIYL